MKEDGAITVFLSMCLLCMSAFLCVMLESARTAGSRYYFQVAANGALDTLFSRYHRQLWEEYRILALEYGSEEELIQNLETYMSEYFSVDNWYPIDLESIELVHIEGLGDKSGDYLAEEVLCYMKYDIVSHFLLQPEEGEKFLKDIKEASSADFLTQAYGSQEKEVQKVEKTMNHLMENIQEQDRLSEKIKEALSENDKTTFLKEAEAYKKTAKEYPKLMKEYEDQVKLLNEKQKEARKSIEEVRPDLQEERDKVFEQQWDPYDTYMEEDAKRIKDFVIQKKTTEENLEVLKETEKVAEELLGGEKSAAIGREIRFAGGWMRADRCQKSVILVGDVGPGVSSGGSEGPGGSSGGSSGGSGGFGDWGEDDDEDDEEEEPTLALAAEYWEENYKKSKIIQTTGTVDVEKKKLFQQVREFLEGGLLELVMPMESVVSEASLPVEYFPSKTAKSEKEDEENVSITGDTWLGTIRSGDSITERIMINEYCGRFFLNALSQEKHPVQYEMEYLLYGKDTEKENLENTVTELFAVREGMNLLHILSDAKKREECRSLALAITGSVGLAPLTEIASWLIMGVWAAGESVRDLQILMSGGKIPLWKQQENWHLSLEALLKLGGDEEVDDDMEQDYDQGFAYGEYLKLLLLMRDPQVKHMRMLDVMQMNIGWEKKGFLIENCLYGVDICGKACGKHVFFTLPIVDNYINGEIGYPLEAAAGKAY